MATGDQDEIEVIDGDEDNGAGSQGSGGQDLAEGADEIELSTEQSDLEEDDGEQEEVIAAPKRGRASETIRELRQRAQEAERSRQELDRRLREIEARSTQNLTAQQEAERLALMTPEERSEYRLNRALEQQNRTFQQMQFQTADQMDRQSYEAKAAANQTYARYQEEVETRLTDLRSRGQNVSREELLKWIIGDKALRSAPKDRAKAVKNGQQRIARQQTNPANARGDHGSRREKQGDTPESRLKDVYI